MIASSFGRIAGCILVPFLCSTTLLAVAVSFSDALSEYTPAEELRETADRVAEEHCTVATDFGPSIYDDDLAWMVNHFIPATNCHSTLLVFTECYGGGQMAAFVGRPNTHALSATGGQIAMAGGYHDDAARALYPWPGRTSDHVHFAGTIGSTPPEVPWALGVAVSLEPTPNDSISSRHVLFYAGMPDTSVMDWDNRDRDVIAANFAQETNTTVTTVGGDGTIDGYDFPARLRGLRDALAGIAPLMGPDEQFILFVGDHGNTDIRDPAPDCELGECQSVTLEFSQSTYNEMLADPNNVPLVSLFSPGPDLPGSVTVLTYSEYFEDVTFDHPIDLNGDDDLEDTGEGWMALVELTEDLIHETGEVITVVGDVDLNLSQINLESGAIARGAPNPVTLIDFTASAEGDHIVVRWNTGSEIDNAGFNLHRGLSQEGPYAQINSQLIPSTGSSIEGASYVYTDADVSEGTTYHYWLEDVDVSGVRTTHGPVAVTLGPSIDEGQLLLPLRFSLAQNYPDPFSTSTDIRYSLPKECDVHLAVYNLEGQRVATLVDEHQEAGHKTVHWDAGSLPGGIYFFTLRAGDFEETRKMTLIR